MVDGCRFAFTFSRESDDVDDAELDIVAAGRVALC